MLQVLKNKEEKNGLSLAILLISEYATDVLAGVSKDVV